MRRQDALKRGITPGALSKIQKRIREGKKLNTKSSVVRKLVLQQMSDKPQIPLEIQKAANKAIRAEDDGKEIRLSDVSRTLSTFVEFGIVECLNPREKVGEKGILYRLTEKGKETQDML